MALVETGSGRVSPERRSIPSYGDAPAQSSGSPLNTMRSEPSGSGR